MALTVSVLGVTCFGLILSTLDHVHLDLLLPARSSACSGFAMPVLDLLHLDLSLPVHSFSSFDSTLPLRMSACLESPSFLVGMSCLGLTMLVLDSIHPDLMLLLRSPARPGFASSILDFLHLGFLTSARNSACVTSSLLAFGKICCGSSFPSLDFSHSGLVLLVQSRVCLGPVLPALDFLHPEFSFPARSMAQLGFLPPVYGQG